MSPTDLVGDDTPAFIDMTADEAREITQTIKATVERAWNLIEGAWKLIVDAYQRRAWLALDYPTWDAYCLGEFGSAPLAVSREERPEMVLRLRQAGLSQRAIATATGVSQKTVDRDLDAKSTESDDSVVLPDKVIGLDGKERPAERPKHDVPQPKPTPKPEPTQRDKELAVLSGFKGALTELVLWAGVVREEAQEALDLAAKYRVRNFSVTVDQCRQVIGDVTEAQQLLQAFEEPETREDV
jgi:hypothetical protein